MTAAVGCTAASPLLVTAFETITFFGSIKDHGLSTSEQHQEKRTVHQFNIQSDEL